LRKIAADFWQDRKEKREKCLVCLNLIPELVKEIQSYERVMKDSYSLRFEDVKFT
jgi:hypothetical protein